MTIRELCIKINLQNEIAEEVIKFSENFDFEKIRVYLNSLKCQEEEKEARIRLKEILGQDERNIKMLSCMLKCACEAYDSYIERGISEEIYIETMKCFTRFIDECFNITGEYAFDREWWTSRQVGCRLFRIGELEYEMKYLDKKPVISLHIPSDANLSESEINISLKNARSFFKKFYLEFDCCDYVCHSWLLAPELRIFLHEKSNILKFQSRFEILRVDYNDTEFIGWVYKKRNISLEELPEQTSLQQKMKKHLLKGKLVGNAFGVMKKL